MSIFSPLSLKAKWTKSSDTKEIYSFNAELATVLIEQDDDIKLPVEALTKLPVPAVWIQIDGDKIGFFVWYDYIFTENGKDFLALRVFFVGENYKLSFFSISLIDGLTVSEGIAHARKFFKKDSLINTSYANSIVSLITYLCAENKDVEENPIQKQFTARTASSVTAPKDVFREIRKWDVGYRVGQKISAAKQAAHQHEQHAQGGGAGTPKRPHVRRGHYHSYWVGSRSAGDRKLIVKWNAPTFIHGEDGDVSATMHEVD